MRGKKDLDNARVDRDPRILLNECTESGYKYITRELTHASWPTRYPSHDWIHLRGEVIGYTSCEYELEAT